MLMVEHNLNVVADLSDTITVLTRGRVLAEGDYATVSQNPRGQRSLSGVRPCLIATHPRRQSHPMRCSRSQNSASLVRRIAHPARHRLRRAAGEVVTLLGRNGAGKTTTLKSIMGIIGKRTGLRPLRRQRGIIRAALRQDRPARASPTARRNAASSRASTSRRTCCCRRRCADGGLTLDDDLRTVPQPARSGSRSQGTKLSGGEQQMLAIARILRTGARFLMLDEPTEGLAPVIIQQIGRTIARLKAQGFTILLVEQNFRFAYDGRGPLLCRGERQDHRWLHSATADAWPSNMEKLSAYLGV